VSRCRKNPDAAAQFTPDGSLAVGRGGFAVFGGRVGGVLGGLFLRGLGVLLLLLGDLALALFERVIGLCHRQLSCGGRAQSRRWRLKAPFSWPLQLPDPEIAALDAPGLEPGQGLVELAAGDGDVAAGGEDVDLADDVRLEAGLPGEGTDDVAGTQLVAAAGI